MMVITLCLMLCAVDFIQTNHVPLGEVKKFILDYHNKLRRREGAADMMKMKWNDQLAREAAAWIKECNFVHQRKGRGENLAFDNESGELNTLFKKVIDNWISGKNYSHQEAVCYKSCHYTQIVWAKTTEVGCAVERCPYLSAFGRNVNNALYFACFYHPKGNVGNDIYTPGSPCSKCPKDASCENGLCVDYSAPCTDSYDTRKCQYWTKSGECKRNSEWMLINCKKSCSVC